MSFRVGQRVVCVDDKPRLVAPVLVRRGHIYTVTDVFETWSGLVGVLLAEVDPGLLPGWHADRFRPITERKTDISVFTEILNRAPNALEPVE